MRRALQLLMLTLLFVQAGGLAWLSGEDACAEACEDDADGEECPPICPTCACAARPAPTVPIAVADLDSAPPLASTLVFSERFAAPPTPDPREILRPPIAPVL